MANIITAFSASSTKSLKRALPEIIPADCKIVLNSVFGGVNICEHASIAQSAERAAVNR